MGEEKIQKDFKKLIEDILKGRKIDSRNDELNKGLEQLKKRTDQIIKDRNTLDYRDNKSIKTIWSDLHKSMKLFIKDGVINRLKLVPGGTS